MAFVGLVFHFFHSSLIFEPGLFLHATALHRRHMTSPHGSNLLRVQRRCIYIHMRVRNHFIALMNTYVCNVAPLVFKYT